MAQITLSNIQKSYGQTQVLKGVDLDIENGEFIALVGASGCGKSTLLRIIAGLEQQSSGKVTINDTDVSSLKPRNRDLAMVFQSYALYPHLTVRQNMLVPLRMAKPFWYRLPLLSNFSKPVEEWSLEINERVEAVAEQLQITALLDRKPAQLSGGQRQRVALGRAMVRQPKAFLMDEPLSNLDAKLRVHMRAELSQLHRKLKSTFIYVTHDQVEAMTMADRIALVVEGQLLQVASPDEMYRNPCHIKVAEFIGSPKINIIKANAFDGKLYVGGQEIDFNLTDDSTSELTEVNVGIRSEHIELVSNPKNYALGVQVTHIENTGSESFVHLKADWTPNQIIVKCSPGKARTLQLGSFMGIQFSTEHLLAFAPGGERINHQSEHVVIGLKREVNYG